MDGMKTLIVVVLVLGLVAEFALCMQFRTISDAAKKRLEEFKNRVRTGGIPGLPIHECNLKRVPPYRDPSIRRTTTPGSSSSAPRPFGSSTRLSSALRGRDNVSAAANALQASSRKILASVARAKAADKSANRTKRQADLSYLADTLETDLCVAREKLITSVDNEGTTCFTLQPQQVKTWECESSFVRGVTNPFPPMQTYHCDPDTHVFISWYVWCPNKAPYVRIHTSSISINCAARRYHCDFEAYQADAPRRF